MTSRSLFTLVLASLLSLSSLPPSYASSSDGRYRTEYDEAFQEAAERWHRGDYEWQWFKAQGFQESLLRPDAVSPAGAQGIMQIMPRTWRDETERLGIIASPFNPEANIKVGVYYMKRMVRFWKAPRTKLQRLELAQASYNAGAGNILAAQTKCGGSTWQDISPCLQKVTGKHSRETIGYVKYVAKWYKEIKRIQP